MGQAVMLTKARGCKCFFPRASEDLRNGIRTTDGVKAVASGIDKNPHTLNNELNTNASTNGKVSWDDGIAIQLITGDCSALITTAEILGYVAIPRIKPSTVDNPGTFFELTTEITKITAAIMDINIRTNGKLTEIDRNAITEETKKFETIIAKMQLILGVTDV